MNFISRFLGVFIIPVMLQITPVHAFDGFSDTSIDTNQNNSIEMSRGCCCRHREPKKKCFLYTFNSSVERTVEINNLLTFSGTEVSSGSCIAHESASSQFFLEPGTYSALFIAYFIDSSGGFQFVGAGNQVANTITTEGTFVLQQTFVVENPATSFSVQVVGGDIEFPAGLQYTLQLTKLE